MADTKGGCCWLTGDLLKFPPYYLVQDFSKKVVCEMPVEQGCDDFVALLPSSAMAYGLALVRENEERYIRCSSATLVSLDLAPVCYATVQAVHGVSIRKGSGRREIYASGDRFLLRSISGKTVFVFRPELCKLPPSLPGTGFRNHPVAEKAPALITSDRGREGGSNQSSPAHSERSEKTWLHSRRWFGQYSSGSSSVVADLSASVMIQMRARSGNV